MKTKIKLSKQWIVVGSISGIIANLLFPILILAPLPNYLEAFLAGLFGVLFSLIGFGIHHLMKFDRPTILTQIGAVFICIAGVIFNIMLMVQLTFKGYIDFFSTKTKLTSDVITLNWITKTVDSIHLGMQYSNDFFTSVAILLFSSVMIKNRFFEKILGYSGIILGVTLLSIKCYTFPLTTQKADTALLLGPIIALWFLTVCIQCLRRNKLIGLEFTSN